MGSAVTGIFCSPFSLYGRHPPPCDRPPLLGQMFVAPISLLRSASSYAVGCVAERSSLLPRENLLGCLSLSHLDGSYP